MIHDSGLCYLVKCNIGSLWSDQLNCQWQQGVMLSHANMVAMIAGVMMVLPGLSSKDSYLAYLPLAHVLELAAEVW